MIDIRYHIYSLAAVFFALAIGIVIGTSFIKNTPGSESEKRTIGRYANSMRLLKHEIEKTAKEANDKEIQAGKSEDFCKTVLPVIVKDRLSMRNVAIIQTGDYDDLSGSIKRTLELAGANVTSITDISRTYDFNDSKAVANALKGCGVTPPANAKQAKVKLFSIIANSIYSAIHPDMLSKLEDMGVAKFTGDYNQFNKLVVLVGGAESDGSNKAHDVDALFIDMLNKLGCRVIGCEGTSCGSSYVPEWYKMGITTIDNTDSAIGQASMVYAFEVEPAKFGVKETADKLIPQNLETK